MTAYGAALADPAQTAAVLRARASAAGITLTQASRADLAAAVLGAHCWAVVTGRSRLSGSMSPVDAAGLAACLARAAGHGARPDAALVDWRPAAGLPAAAMAAMAPVVRWAVEHAGPEAVHLAAQDLAASGAERIVAAAGFLADCLEDVTAGG